MTEQEKCEVLESLNEGDMVEITMRGVVCEIDKRKRDDGKLLVDVWIWNKLDTEAVLLSNFAGNLDDVESIRMVEP